MTRTRPIILLTGFGPFPGVPRNASADLVAQLGAIAPNYFSEFDFVPRVLPVDWSETPHRLLELLRKSRPAISVHFGVSSRATGFVIEQHAYNETHAIEDDTGRAPDTGRLVAGDRSRRTSTLPARTIVKALHRHGYPAVLSEDPGRYLCNAVLFHALRHATAADPRTRSGFVHIPASLDGTVQGAPSLISWEEALSGSLRVIEACVHASRRTLTVARRSAAIADPGLRHPADHLEFR